MLPNFELDILIKNYFNKNKSFHNRLIKIKTLFYQSNLKFYYNSYVTDLLMQTKLSLEKNKSEKTINLNCFTLFLKFKLKS